MDILSVSHVIPATYAFSRQCYCTLNAVNGASLSIDTILADRTKIDNNYENLEQYLNFSNVQCLKHRLW